MEQVLNIEAKIQEKRLCPTHNKPILFLSTGLNQSTNDRVLKCASCISKEMTNNLTSKQIMNAFIPIEDMEIQKDPYKLDNWFINFNESQLAPLLSSNQDDFLSEFDSFLKTFRTGINSKIDQFSQEVKKRYEEIEQNRQRIISYAQKMSYYSEIQTIFQNSSDYETLMQQLNEIIKTVKTQKPLIEKNFKTVADSFNLYSSYLNLNHVKTIQTVVDEALANFQKVYSYQVLDVIEFENNRIKPIQQNPNFQKNVLIGYQFQCSSKEQIQTEKTQCYQKDRPPNQKCYCIQYDLNKYYEQIKAIQMYKNVY